MSTHEQIMSILEDTAAVLKKMQINLKKCPKARLTRGYVEARLKMLDEYWDTFKKAHQDLVKIMPKEQRAILPYFVNEEFYLQEDLYVVLQADLRDMLLPSNVQPSTSSDCTLIENNYVQLPRIHLPAFSGNYEEWITFKDLFISMVHNNSALSDVQKLHYLKSSVTGEAESLLKHIQVTNNNYIQAWEVLSTRYGHKRLIVNATLKRLFNIRKISTQTPNQLKTLLDVTCECLHSLKNLNVSTESWDPIIIFLVVQKLDPDSHKEWEQCAYKTNPDELPTWLELRNFLETKYRTLELVSCPTPAREKAVKERSFHIATPVTPQTSSSGRICIKCKDSHTLCHCKLFSKMDTENRRDFVKSNNLCFNCLASGHSVMKCRIPVSCRICHRRHHSLLHVDQSSDAQNSTPVNTCVEETQEVQVNTTIASHLNLNTTQSIALLATAIVPVTNQEGHTILLRALIDQGSQAAFISERATQMLKLKKQPVKGTIVGVGSTRTDVKHVVQLHIGSRWDTNFRLFIQPYVMNKQLTAKIPTQVIINNNWQHLEGLNLADSSYLTPGPIDMLLGIKEYTHIIQEGIIKGAPGTPCAQQTSLGWIIFGEISTNIENKSFLVMHHSVDMDDMLKSIWEVDNDTKRKLTREEQRCEEIYRQTHSRNEAGRYIVTLPFKTDNPKSPDGNTKEIAMKRLLQLERKFKRIPDLKQQYTKVIEEYLLLNHMEEVPEEEINNRSVYLPHHAVVNEQSESTNFRVVFDASSKDENSTANVSLNDELLVGPQLQEELRNIVMRWRMKRICFIADIQKMYRQVLVKKSDADYQRILWRTDSSQDVKSYRLLRVTFGTAAAPYLAVKTLHQIAEDEKHVPETENTHINNTEKQTEDRYLPAAQVIKEDFYIDDLMSGADTIQQAMVLAKEIGEMLEKGGFTLAKWASNSVEFMENIKPEKRSIHAQVNINMDGTIKALGLKWDLKQDEFRYTQHLLQNHSSITKRTILSDIQKLFDPLGWISPSIVSAKMLIQKLWIQKLGWDDEVNPDIKEEWLNLREDYNNIHDIRINRWLETDRMCTLQIHGFSDASMNAYAATVYLRVENLDGQICTKLIASRTRVAPVKTISLPRLELCGALLLSRLLKQVGEAMRQPTSNMFAWTDSLIVIAWLSGEPNKWKPFVANRVVEITEVIPSERWLHVRSQENPADVASRGMMLTELKTCDLWWRGPHWLTEKEIPVTTTEITPTTLELKGTQIQTNVKLTKKNIEKSEIGLANQFEQFISLTELLKTIAYCRRFLNYNKTKNVETGPSALTTQELEHALKNCVKIVQYEDYETEIIDIKRKKSISKRSQLKCLNPYLDEDDILRVGGRLRHANMDDYSKHPIILSNKNQLTSLIVADAHVRTMHGGIQLMLTYLRTKFWIIRCKALIKSHIHKCWICAKHNATPRTQIMGDLPKERVTPSRPFLHSGVDFAGPLHVLLSKGRGAKTKKAYIAIFVCFSTKAMHLELVGDLTSEAFIGAFKRFVSRRGRCTHLWSDQGRNFVGANKDLVAAWHKTSLEVRDMAESLALDGTQWHFIPAYSPNFGGLWEAGVKSIKYHLKRILNTNLTFEEMATVLCEIEACLNSRPLSTIDDDIGNITPLTPGHFLIGEAPIVVPSPSLENVKVHNLSRWQHTQKLVGDFWRRWQTEYLTRLQQRPKWLSKTKDFEKGDIVLIKADGLPPGKWSLGRIVDKHPGADKATRVYSVKSGDSVTKRSITKLCAMPIDTETD